MFDPAEMSAEQADEAEAALCQDIFDAASQGRVAAVRHFLRGNAALVNEESTTGRSLLHLAMDTDVVELMELLLRSHADVNFADWLGQTVLHLACARSLDPPIGVLRLLDARAQVNEIDEFGLTPLHKAAERGQVALIQSLLEAQANACATTPEGITPLGLAREGLHSAAVEVLQHPDLYVDLVRLGWVKPLFTPDLYGAARCATPGTLQMGSGERPCAARGFARFSAQHWRGDADTSITLKEAWRGASNNLTIEEGW
eukprot:g5016.t1